MLCKTVRIPMISFAVLLTCAATCPAQFMPGGLGGLGAQPGAISGTGAATIKLKPQLVRMSVQMSAKAKTLKEALETLKDQREAAILQLEQLGAETKSILTTPPTAKTGLTDREKQMQQMLMQQRRSQGRKVGKGLNIPKSVTATMVLTAEWSLPSEDEAEILLFVNDVREKIIAADLAGAKKLAKKSPEEEELAEEASGMMGMYSSFDEQQSKPGEPTFFYVGRVTDKQRAKLLADAFAKAKTQAEQLAAAAGMKLGALVSLSGAANQGDMNMNRYGGMSSYQMQMLLASQARAQGGDRKESESLGASLDALAFSVYVHADFALSSAN